MTSIVTKTRTPRQPKLAVGREKTCRCLWGRTILVYSCRCDDLRFAHFELDLAAVELRAGGRALGLEPQVFALLALLVENRERLVSKAEIIEKVWDGRMVSDAAVASRIKSVRQALGDDGKSQQFVRTIHGQGYRFVAQARASRSAAQAPASAGSEDETHHGLSDMVQRLDRISRPSLAVLPFRFVGSDERYAALATALPDELITDSRASETPLSPGMTSTGPSR